jgi:hypothetical protein
VSERREEGGQKGERIRGRSRENCFPSDDCHDIDQPSSITSTTCPSYSSHPLHNYFLQSNAARPVPKAAYTAHRRVRHRCCSH